MTDDDEVELKSAAKDELVSEMTPLNGDCTAVVRNFAIDYSESSTIAVDYVDVALQAGSEE